MPPGKACSASAWSMPAARAPAWRAVRVQPSKGTCGKVAFRSASRWASRSMGLALRQFRRLGAADRGRTLGHAVSELLGEGERGEVGQARGIEDAVEMVALVLHHAGVEAAGFALDALALKAVAVIADARPSRHRAGEAGDGEAGPPTPRLFLRAWLGDG